MDTIAEARAFYELAREYCQWAAQGPTRHEPDSVRALRLVAALYHRALFLPEVEPETLTEEHGLTKLDAAGIYERFKALPFQYYSEVFHPVGIGPEEPVTGDLAGDLRDIYVDLQAGIQHYEAGRLRDAIFEWRTSFGFHWGRHATSALRALHCYETDPERNEL